MACIDITQDNEHEDFMGLGELQSAQAGGIVSLLSGVSLALATEAKAKAGSGLVEVRLTVTALPTSDGLVGKGLYSYKYPKTIYVQIPAALVNQIDAYGASYKVWLGPKNWTGDAQSGVDGNAVILLHPAAGTTKLGARIGYSEIPACYACMLGAAAPYFNSARQIYKSTYDKDGRNPINVKLPEGTQVKSISSSLVTYAAPDSRDLATRGVVLYGRDSGGERHYVDAKFILPVRQLAVLDFLEAYFIASHRAK